MEFFGLTREPALPSNPNAKKKKRDVATSDSMASAIRHMMAIGKPHIPIVQLQHLGSPSTSLHMADIIRSSYLKLNPKLQPFLS